MAKYINAPATEAKRFEQSEFPPTAFDIHSDGIIPSPPGRPSRNPAAKTPIRSNGRIILAYHQDSPSHSPVSPFVVARISDKPTTPVRTSVIAGGSTASHAARIAAATVATFQSLTSNHNTRLAPNTKEKNAVRYHFRVKIRNHKPLAASGLAKFAKTSIATIAAK